MDSAAGEVAGASTGCNKLNIKEEHIYSDSYWQPFVKIIKIEESYIKEGNVKLELPEFRITRDLVPVKKEKLEIPDGHDVCDLLHVKQEGLWCCWFGWGKQETERDVREDTNDWETECPPEICISYTNIEADLQETAISDDGIALRPPTLYGLPKIHKTGALLHPIVNTIGSPT